MPVSPHPLLVAPSLLSADFAHLADDVAAMAEAGADWLHLDVMDGHFVPNISFGPLVLKALRPLTALPFDVHLMIAPVDPFLDAFVEAGAQRIAFHPEAGPHPHRTAQRIRSLGARPGVVLSPGTPIAAVEELIGIVDHVLVMTVNPGFGGQSFLEGPLDKIARLRAMIDRRSDGREIRLEVDGGVDAGTAPRVIAAGADVLVAGTAAFRGGRGAYAANLAALRGG
jgi:ribulose-phosphate 3-epimerase